jgi:S1-C subfamily serine protease
MRNNREENVAHSIVILIFAYSLFGARVYSMNKGKKNPLAWINNSGYDPKDVSLSHAERANFEDVSDAEFLDAYSEAVIKVVDLVGPAIVSISIGEGNRHKEFTATGAGSGVVFTPNGYILTNTHIVSKAKQIVRYHNLKSEYAVEIASVDPKGPAKEAGIIPGDIVVGINGQDVMSIDDIYRVLAEWSPGRDIMVRRIRGKNQTSVKVIPSEAN